MSLVWGKQQPSEIRTREAGGEAFRKIMEGRPGPRTIRVVIRPQEQGVEGGGSGTEKKSMPVYFESRVARGLS